MSSEPTNAEEVRTLVERQLAEFADSALAARVSPLLRDPVAQTLLWEYGKLEPFTAWRFADLGERDVWVAYCAGGHGALGNPWGLVFVDIDHFGMDCGWYPTLADLFEEWFA